MQNVDLTVLRCITIHSRKISLEVKFNTDEHDIVKNWNKQFQNRGAACNVIVAAGKRCQLEERLARKKVIVYSILLLEIKIMHVSMFDRGPVCVAYDVELMFCGCRQCI